MKTLGLHSKNSHCAAALYVPLLHYPVKTAAKQPTSQRSPTFGKRCLRLQARSNFGDNWRTLKIAAARIQAERLCGERKTSVPELRAPDMTLRARTYRFRAFSQFTEARKVLLP
jgi:hypothetical protein